MRLSDHRSCAGGKGFLGCYCQIETHRKCNGNFPEIGRSTDVLRTISLWCQKTRGISSGTLQDRNLFFESNYVLFVQKK